MQRGAARELAGQFEHLVRQIFEANRFNVRHHVSIERVPNWRIDFRISTPDDVDRLVDVKMLPAPSAGPSLMRDLVGLYGANIGQLRDHRFTLVVSSEVDENTKSWINEEFSIEVWDRHRLRALAGEYGRILFDFDRFLARVDQLSLEERLSEGRDHPLGIRRSTELGLSAVQLAIESDPSEGGARGADLCIELRGHPAGGGKAALLYEELCAKILDYLFPGELVDANSTRRTEDGLSIFDIAYRVTNKGRFWHDLTRDFRCRVLLAECKNYKSGIGAGQIYSTERYLSIPALRTVCFMLTREKPKNAALKAAAGALRESGKLIIFLTDDDLCKMLHMRDIQIGKTNTEEREEFDPALVINKNIHTALASLSR